MNKTTDIYLDKWFSFIVFIIVFLFIQIFDFTAWKLYSFIIKNIFLIVLLFYNIKKYRGTNPKNWLLNPVVLASLFTFCITYCFTNFIYFIPGSYDEKLMLKLLGTEPLIGLNKGMNAVIISAIAMWIGYTTRYGNKLYHLILRYPINFKKYFRSSFSPNLQIIYLIFGLAIAARLYAINLGIFGFSQSPDRLTASMGIAYILISFSELTSLCLLIVSFSYFQKPYNLNYKISFYLMIAIEIGFGILKGSKSAVIMPFVLSFITYYIVNKKFNKSFLVAIILFIFIAYTIIEPFRQLRHRDQNFQSTPTYIINTMVDAFNLNQSTILVNQNNPIINSILSRNAYLLGASKAIQYEDDHGLSASDPDFLQKIYTIPLQAFIPRLFWTGKPIEDAGNWFSINVWKSTRTGSVAITPIGFLYFAGGFLFICLGFFIIGILQKMLWQFFLAGGGQILIFLVLLSTVVFIDSSFNGTIVYWLRFFPVFIFLQSIVLKK